MKAVYFLLLSFFLIPSTRFSQEVNDRTTGIKIERLLFLVEQMYVEDVDTKKLNQDLVLGMYNTYTHLDYINQILFLIHLI